MELPFYSATSDGARLLNAMSEYERELELLDRELELRRYDPAPALLERVEVEGD